MKTLSTRFPIADFSTLRVGLVIHPSLTALRREYRRLERERAEDTFAFCHYFWRKGRPRIVQEDLLATLHFCPGHLTVGSVAHEALHAAKLYSSLAYLNEENAEAEELLADVVENLTDQVVRFCQDNGVDLRL